MILKKSTKYITCLHKNNLCSYPMSESLPKDLPLLTLFKTRIKNKKIISCIRTWSIKMEKLCIEFNTKRKSRNAFYKLMNNTVYGRAMENMREGVENNEKKCLKGKSKPS